MSSYLENEQEGTKEYNPRYKILYISVGLAALVLVSRLWYLQIMEGQVLREYSERNRVKETKIPAPRGLILDREGRVLVENLPGFQCVISPQYAKNLQETAEAISPIINIPVKQIIKEVKVSRRRNGPFRPVRIKENLTMDEVVRLKKLRFDHPGMDIQQTILRSYTLSEKGAQLLGYVGEISKSQIPKYNKKYRGQFVFKQGDIVGKSGIEEVWEKFLRGTDGRSLVEVDARGRLARTNNKSFFGIRSEEAVPGHNLVLTIDMDMQNAAWQAMQREDRIGPRIGSLVAMKTNGEVLAWISRPSYDPNQFSTGISSDLWTQLINDPFKPLRNKVIQDHYPPASTFKPIVALAALQEKIIRPNTIISSPGSMRFGSRTYHDSIRSGHGNINVKQAIERSGNVFFYKMGIQLGIDRLAKYAKLLGIGESTSIGLANEKPGMMPTKEWKLKELGEEWQPGENLSNAIGQGFVLTTAIQLAKAYNTIALDGKVVKPFIVKKVLDIDNNFIEETEPKVLDDLSVPDEEGTVISKENFSIVKQGLYRVANGERGTARWWKINGVKFAGKTGTSQVMSFSADDIYTKCETRPINQRNHGWFVGYAPIEKPEITVAVFAEHGCHGSTGGAPVVRDLVEAYFKKYHPGMIKPRWTPPKRVASETPAAPKPETNIENNRNDDSENVEEEEI